MSSQVRQQRINTIDREIANLERRIADQTRTEAQCQRTISSIEKTLKNCSPCSLNGKLAQLESQQRSMQQAIDRRADISAQIARKRAERARESIALQRELEQESKRERQAQASLMKNYEDRISQLSAALTQSYRKQAAERNIYSESGTAEFDVFISHATEDKASFVRDFATELERRGVKVWFDELSIKWGDSLRSEIDKGLKRSRFGIVVISRHFIKKGWTNYELDGLFAKEMSGGKTILPIWHDISKKEVQDFSLSLAGRKAMSTGNMTAAEIANELVKLLPERGESSKGETQEALQFDDSNEERDGQ